MSIETHQGIANGVATYQPQSQLPAVRPRTVVRLTEWAESAKAAYEVATTLVKTSFVPEVFRNKLYEATAAILAGDELGFSPMASLRAFDVIQGSAAPKAITQRAVVQSRGHAIWKVESSSTRAIFRGRRADSGEVQESVWTIERARQLGLTNKPNWKNQPEAMLIARATSECSRLVASDALLGIPYSAEEIADGVTGEYPTVAPVEHGPEQPESPPPPARRTAQRRSQPRSTQPPAPTPEQASDEPTGPPLLGEEDDVPPDPTDASDELNDVAKWVADIRSASTTEDLRRLRRDHPWGTLPLEVRQAYTERAAELTASAADKPASAAQKSKLGAIMCEGAITDAGQRHYITSQVLGRPITSWNELTVDDASALIETLEPLAKQGPLAEVYPDLPAVGS